MDRHIAWETLARTLAVVSGELRRCLKGTLRLGGQRLELWSEERAILNTAGQIRAGIYGFLEKLGIPARHEVTVISIPYKPKLSVIVER